MPPTQNNQTSIKPYSREMENMSWAATDTGAPRVGGLR